MDSIKIFVATHKPYEFPKDEIYQPIQVGCALSSNDFGYEKDNQVDENISNKNPSFCELTALYEVWKNKKYSELRYIGLSHYRRYFQGELLFKKKKILGKKEALELLKEYDIIVPKKRNYYIETIYNHYKNAHHERDLLETKKIIQEKYPEYINSFEKIMNGTKLHLFNMFVMKKEDFDRYMNWLFDILFELEKRIDISNYDSYQKRVFGFLSERLFNVWLDKMNLKKKELKVINIEGERYTFKILNMLKRKYIKNIN